MSNLSTLFFNSVASQPQGKNLKSKERQPFHVKVANSGKIYLSPDAQMSLEVGDGDYINVYVLPHAIAVVKHTDDMRGVRKLSAKSGSIDVTASIGELARKITPEVGTTYLSTNVMELDGKPAMVVFFGDYQKNAAKFNDANEEEQASMLGLK